MTQSLTAAAMAERMVAWGVEIVNVTELGERFAALGYTVDRSMDCRSMARIMTGELAGTSYPCVTTGLIETDTGMSAFHYQARRDANFRKMQALRMDIVAISKGAILEV